MLICKAEDAKLVLATRYLRGSTAWCVQEHSHRCVPRPFSYKSPGGGGKTDLWLSITAVDSGYGSYDNDSDIPRAVDCCDGTCRSPIYMAGRLIKNFSMRRPRSSARGEWAYPYDRAAEFEAARELPRKLAEREFWAKEALKLISPAMAASHKPEVRLGRSSRCWVLAALAAVVLGGASGLSPGFPEIGG
eukprot:Skav219684  [mRNA]  locus=scaffold817:78987:81731:- [translate_table: standard]